MDSLLALLKCLESRSPTLYESEAGASFGPDWPMIQTAGWVRPASPSRHARCPGCGLHSSEIRYGPQAGSEQLSARIMCRECGLTEVPSAQIRRWSIDVARFLADLGTVLGTSGPPRQCHVGPLWRLGLIRVGIQSKEAFVGVGLNASHFEPVSKYLVGKSRGILFVPTTATWQLSTPPGPEWRLALSEYLTFTQSQLRFDHPKLASVFRERAVPRSRPTKTVSRRGKRPADLERLTREMVEHLRGARDHAAETLERNGVAELLPRPSQRALGKQCQIPEATVSRCLNRDQSEAAKLLQIFWQTAADLDGVMRWRPPRRR